MTYQTIAFDICRYYIEDYAHCLTPELKSKALGYVRARNLTGLADIGNLYDPNIHDRHVFGTLRQISAFFKKNKDFSDPEVCQSAALSSFEEGESICKTTNDRLDQYYVDRCLMTGIDVPLLLDRMSSYISWVLGDFEQFRGDLPQRIKFTNGATSTRPRRKAHAYLKLNGRIPCAPGARKYVKALAKYFGYGFVVPESSVSNRVITVPKNWKTDRTIACEPDGNIPLQLAFDTYLKGRLRRLARIDLSDQFRNQALAKKGSEDGSLATVDLSMASDTLALNTVWLLFPDKWAEYLGDIRSGFFRINEGNLRKYHKFSSMGNGCTFGLETLVFASACHAVGSNAYSVYGDDIIIESELYESLVELLAFLGFVVNHEKSYSTGPFRESCGKDYFEGHDVTPRYLREWSDRKTVLSHNINNLVYLGYPGSKLWKFCYDLVKDRRLPLVPWNQDSYSGVFIPETTAYSLRIIKVKNQQPYFNGYKSQDLSRRIYDSRALFLWFYAAMRSPRREEFLERSRVSIGLTRYVRGRIWFRVEPEVTPLQLYSWGDLFTRRETGR